MGTNHLATMSHEEKRLKCEEKMRFLLDSLANTAGRINLNYKNVPKTVQMLYLRVFCTKTSIKDHVKLKCLDCCCFDKEEVRRCSTITCPLHKIRPFK